MILSSDEMAAGLVFVFFLIVSLIVIRSGRTKLKSRYGYMMLSFVFSIIILLHVIQSRRQDNSTLSMFIKESSIDKFDESNGDILHSNKEQASPVSREIQTEKRDKKELPSPKPNRISKNYRFTHVQKEQIELVRRHLFLELYKHRDMMAKYSKQRKNNNTNLLPSISNKEAKIRYANYLPWWELEEMIWYLDIWYVGLNHSKFEYDPDDTTTNFGFDEWEDDNRQEDGDEKMLKIAIGDHLGYRYEILRVLGHGSYGRVVLSRDHAVPPNHQHHEVAIKIMHNESQTVRFFKQELSIHQYITDHTENPELYTKILRTFFFRNHYYIVFELLGTSIFRLIDEPINEISRIRRFLKDIMTPLNNLHKIQMVHGDLKPENLMMIRGCNESCKPMLKLADFNLACTPKLSKFPCPGVYFQTRHYRAPEVILDLNYTVQADMWSVGVLTAELYLGQLPFYGESATDQLAAIMEVQGLIPAEMVKVSPRIQTYQKAVNYKCKNGFKRRPYRKPLETILKGCPPLLYHFIRNCLILDPENRMTSFQALQHPFILSTTV